MRRRSLAEAARLDLPQAAGEIAVENTSRPRRVVPVDLVAIEVPARRRSVDPDQVQVIAESLQQIGLQVPVVLRMSGNDGAGFVLVAGAHRLAAAQRLGWTRIDALIVDRSADDDEVALIEIDENLARVELTPLDRAQFLAERREIFRRLNPEAGQRGRRPTKSVGSEIGAKFAQTSFEEDAQVQTGLSRRGVYRALEIGTRLVPDLVTALRDTPIARREGDLHQLAQMDVADQETAAKCIRAADTPPAKLADIVEAPVRARAAKTPRDRLLECWERASPEDRRWFLDRIREGGGCDIA